MGVPILSCRIEAQPRDWGVLESCETGDVLGSACALLAFDQEDTLCRLDMDFDRSASGLVLQLCVDGAISP